MSMGIYYNAKRSTPFSREEEAQIQKITDKYWKEYARKDQYEGPGTFSPEDGEGAVYHGVLRIPLEFMEDESKGMEAMEEFVDYWLKWLTDVTRAIPGAEWEAQLEEVPLIWDEETGWRVMSDEEFAQMGFA